MDLAHVPSPDIRFTRERNNHSPQRDRPTGWLFIPVMQPTRSDPRFDALMTDLGLKGYWDAAGARPDYRRR